MDYCLYDTVLFYSAGEAESYVGKIVEIFETTDHVKKVKVVWFFRPSEIRNYLGDYKPKWNELFLASGKGVGVSNINPMEAVMRKCNVACVSSDPRNSTSDAAIRSADYIFRMTFDVEAHKISKKFPDQIDGVIVERFFNTLKCQNPHKQNYIQRNVKREYAKCFSAPIASEEQPCKKIKQDDVNDEEIKSIPQNYNQRTKKLDMNKDERMKSSPQKCPRVIRMETFKDEEKKSITCPLRKQGFSEQYLSSQRPSTLTAQLDNTKWFKPPEADNTKWFKPPEISWKERLETAQKQDTLVLLENLDLSWTSSEVEEIVLSALKEEVKARMIPPSSFSPGLYGRAFVIFNSKDAAKTAVDRLNKGCLMLSDQRPVVASRGFLSDPERPTEFPGHYKIRQKRMNEDMRSAIATGHCAQHNTIEYTMAMDWWVGQEKTEMAVKALREKQEKEMCLLKGRLRMI